MGGFRPNETIEERSRRTEAAQAARLANIEARRVDPDAAATFLIRQASFLAPLGPEQTKRIARELNQQSRRRVSEMSLPDFQRPG